MTQRAAPCLRTAIRYTSTTARLARRGKASLTTAGVGAAANLHAIQDEFGRQAVWFETDWNKRSKRSTSEIMDWVMAVVNSSNKQTNNRTGMQQTTCNTSPSTAGATAGAAALDVATGTGIFARALAGAGCASVVGIDVTKEMLAHAESSGSSNSLDDVTDVAPVLPSYLLCDAASMPFEDDAFDLVTCRLAVHHFADPAVQLTEMARVCKPGGIVVVVDLITVADPDHDGSDAEVKCAAAEHNRLEILRDPSHTRALSATELCGLVSASGLDLLQSEDGRTSTGESSIDGSGVAVPTLDVMMDLEAWMASTNTPQAAQAEITAAMEAEVGVTTTPPTLTGAGTIDTIDATQESVKSFTSTGTGMFPTQDDDGRILFTHTYAVVRGLKPHVQTA